MPDRLTEERVAKNDAMFRDANKQIAAVAAQQEITEPALPFLCECADVGCTEIVKLRLAEYRELRSNPRWFVNTPAHQEGSQSALVARRDGYVIVEKQGHAGDVAAELARTPEH
jgi:hypothetical protein